MKPRRFLAGWLAGAPVASSAPAAGEEIIIAKAVKPDWHLVPLAPETTAPRTLGILTGKLNVSDTFDDPLPDDLIDLFYKGPIFPAESSDALKGDG